MKIKRKVVAFFALLSRYAEIISALSGLPGAILEACLGTIEILVLREEIGFRWLQALVKYMRVSRFVKVGEES